MCTFTKSFLSLIAFFNGRSFVSLIAVKFFFEDWVWNAEGNIYTYVFTCWPGTKFNFSKIYDRKRLLQIQVLLNSFRIFFARVSMALKFSGRISQWCCVFSSVKTCFCGSLCGTTLTSFVSVLEPDQCQGRNDFSTFVFPLPSWKILRILKKIHPGVAECCQLSLYSASVSLWGGIFKNSFVRREVAIIFFAKML
jgi:hypothetical protein